MRNPDPLGYYAVLQVKPSASDVEVQKAYAMLRANPRRSVDPLQLREAIAVLGDSEHREAYDDHNEATDHQRRWRLWAGGAALVLCVVMFPQLMHRVGAQIPGTVTRFEPGDTLFRRSNDEKLGTVLIYQNSHTFHNGESRGAYQLEHADASAPQWYPASEIERLYRSRRID